VAIGVVWGRRRAGKSFLLRRLVADGVYHQALDETPAAGRARLADLVAARVGVAPGTVRFDDWLVAFEALLDAGNPAVVVLDEFPYLLRQSPELPSVLQRLHDDRRSGPAKRLLLCGSSLSVMSSLLTGSQPLRGRARLDLRVPVFDYRQAADYWGIADPRLALAVDAVLGGAAGYRDLVEHGPPSSLDDFGAWLSATVLNPSHALYREDEFLLREDPRISDRGLYNSILLALAAGESTPSRLGGRLGRDRTSLAYVLNVLIEAGLVRKDEDLGSPKRPSYVVADPIVRFARLIVAPNRLRLDERDAAAVWAEAQHTWQANILGPHLEQVARRWVAAYASRPTLGGAAGRVGSLTVADRANRTTLQLDLAATDGAGRYLVLGEVKATAERRDIADLRRLERARALAGDPASEARLMLVSAAGFAPALSAEASGRADVELVDLDRLYTGD
jgi:hypothetical protein